MFRAYDASGRHPVALDKPLVPVLSRAEPEGRGAILPIRVTLRAAPPPGRTA
jgi:hypothetical protein